MHYRVMACVGETVLGKRLMRSTGVSTKYVYMYLHTCATNPYTLAHMLVIAGTREYCRLEQWMEQPAISTRHRLRDDDKERLFGYKGYLGRVLRIANVNHRYRR